ncbi:hypothetical protein [Pseudoxanthomonas sp.]|uniref:hypothetical protein n=1 Tax=Pseudoxanthomonas sp. TaxID=1871049 RepID=UPI0026260F47|nr:hypothetical protein [Pseudoxanthomonas sp.]WDS34946.1 MAG: hypothetical protein O8I58_11215 [Pseudoxanthomonas sp.]
MQRNDFFVAAIPGGNPRIKSGAGAPGHRYAMPKTCSGQFLARRLRLQVPASRGHLIFHNACSDPAAGGRNPAPGFNRSF